MSEAEELEPEFLGNDLVFISGAVEPLRVVSHDEMAWADFEMMVENGQVIEGRDGAHVQCNLGGGKMRPVSFPRYGRNNQERLFLRRPQYQ